MPNVFSAPTVSASGALPGDVMLPSTMRPSALFPELPAATTTTMPAFTASATASQSGSVRYGSLTGWPSDRLMTRMLYFALFAITHSTPAMTSLVRPVPSAPSTRTLIRLAPGAMPPVYSFVT